MGATGVIFDLDDTLLDTSMLTALRAAGRWGRCMARLGEVAVFDVPAGETAVVKLPQRLHKRGLRVGLLTHSPSHYARALLDGHGIRVDAMVTGSDRFPPKPNPTGLLAVADQLDVDPAECLYVGDSVGDFGAAASAGMRSVGVAWGRSIPSDWERGWPDVVVDRPSLLLAYTEGDERLGLAGEVYAAGSVPALHWGSIARLSHSTFALGRYFVTSDQRAQTHELSELVLQAKDDPAAAEAVAEIFGTVAEGIGARPGPQLVVSVPPRPGETYDRFAPVRAALASAYGAEDGGDLLKMRFAVDDYKAMNHDERKARNTRRFAARRRLKGSPHVLLVDDVLSSGSQIEDCRRALRQAGAGNASAIVLAVTQEALPEACPECGGNLRVKTNSYSGERFIGCSNYWLGCEYSRDL
jgi:HAD superfamily hydrolase (TIGR01549 family)